MEGGGLPPSATSRRLLFLVACLFLAFTTGAIPVRYCDREADYPVKVEGVQITPDPVIRGRPAKFSISAFTEDEISGGKLPIDVRYYGIHVHHETRELCDETSCPVSPGDFVITHEQTLPTYTPPGSYTLTLKILGEGGSELTCIMFDFKIRISSLVEDS